MRQITFFIHTVSCCLPLLLLSLIFCFCPLPRYIYLDRAHFPHSGGGGDHKGWPDLLLIFIFSSLPFYWPLMLPSQRLLDILIDSLPLLFQRESSNATLICLSLMIYSFLPDISRFSFIVSSKFISASSSSLRGRSRLVCPL